MFEWPANWSVVKNGLLVVTEDSDVKESSSDHCRLTLYFQKHIAIYTAISWTNLDDFHLTTYLFGQQPSELNYGFC